MGEKTQRQKPNEDLDPKVRKGTDTGNTTQKKTQTSPSSRESSVTLELVIPVPVPLPVIPST